MKKYLKSFAVFFLIALVIAESIQVGAAAKQRYSKATARWKAVPNAAYYNLYYKVASDKKYAHAVSHLSPSTTSFTISYLKRGVSYVYTVAAVDNGGKEFSTSGLKYLLGVPQ